MGVDLRLLPVDFLSMSLTGDVACHRSFVRWGFSHTVLTLPGNRAAWEAFKGIGAEPVPRTVDVSTWTGQRVPDGSLEGETMYGRLRERDAYDCPFTWLPAAKLKPVLAEFWPRSPTTAYIAACPDDMMVILDWH